MAYVQYDSRRVPVALHVTVGEWEALKAHAVASAPSVYESYTYRGLRVYLIPEPAEPPSWWRRAVDGVLRWWRWLLGRWRAWEARVMRPEVARARPPTRPLTVHPWLFHSSVAYRLKTSDAAVIRITHHA